MSHRCITAALAAAALIPTTLPAQAAQAAPSSQVIVAHSASIAWAPGPPSLPPGAEFVLLERNPAEAVPLTLRLLHSVGPWSITYLNTADDPRNKRPAGNE